MRDVATALVRWLDNVFGERLVSSRAIAVSICLSFSSALAFAGIVALVDPTPDPMNPKIVVTCLPLSYSLFAIAVGQRWRHLLTVTSFILGGGVIGLSLTALAMNPEPLHALTIPASALLGMSCDFVVIVLARRLVMVATSVTILNASAIATVSAILGTALLCTPVLVMYNDGANWDSWAAIGFAAGLMNLYAGVVAIAFFALNLMFVLQRVLWSAIERPIYAMERFGLFQRRRTLFYCGALLMALGFPRIADSLFRAFDLFQR